MGSGLKGSEVQRFRGSGFRCEVSGVSVQASGQRSYETSRGRIANRRISNIEYRMSKEGILSILSKKIKRSDSTLRQSSVVIHHSIFHQFLFRSDRPFFWPAAGLKPLAQT